MIIHIGLLQIMEKVGRTMAHAKQRMWQSQVVNFCMVILEFLHGYIDNMHTRENENIPVVIWKEYVGGWQKWNIHCTTNLDQDSWETAKS